MAGQSAMVAGDHALAPGIVRDGDGSTQVPISPARLLGNSLSAQNPMGATFRQSRFAELLLNSVPHSKRQGETDRERLILIFQRDFCYRIATKLGATWRCWMKILKCLALLSFLLLGIQGASQEARAPETTGGEPADLRVILLGTGAGPLPNAQRFGISTLVIAGTEKLMFDCGRAATIRMSQLGIQLSGIMKLFITHLHSDHVIGIPDLYLAGWVQGRQSPLQVWGPSGTRDMMEHIQKAFAFDIHIRRDVDEKFSAEGIKMTATDIQQGVVYESNGVKVTAFLVDHGPVKPAFGYRVDYQGHSVVMSGDTKPSENLIRFSEGVDLLIHEVGGSKQDPRLTGPPNEIPPGAVMTREQLRIVAAHHTDGVEAGQVFARVKPRLAVFSHGGGPAAVSLVRQNYSGPVEIGEDMMSIDVGEKVEIHRFKSDSK